MYISFFDLQLTKQPFKRPHINQILITLFIYFSGIGKSCISNIHTRAKTSTSSYDDLVLDTASRCRNPVQLQFATLQAKLQLSDAEVAIVIHSTNFTLLY